MMAKNYSRVLLVTANVGSIFEEPDKMIPIWMEEFIAVIKRLEPEFLAIHCQEVGGKNYEESMQHVNKFIKLLLSVDEMQQFDRARVFLDEDFTAVEKFTALGSLYFVHNCVSSVEIFDFVDAKFVPIEGKEVLSGNIEHVRIKEKAKFAQEFFPDFVWSRKGFIRTRWNLYGTIFDLVNIHLIHDVSNIAAMDTSPSTYSDFRVRALLHTIERFETDQYEKVPFFMFGDYNFRLDTHRLVKQLTADVVEQRVTGKKNDVCKVVFKEPNNGKVILTVGKKEFHHHEHNKLFSRTNAMTLRSYDTEPETCRSKLFEYQVTFPPSYPFSEDTEDGTSYMPTRCPGWCDRIMMSYDAPNLFHVDNGFTSEYKMMGMHICMGDHKPIYLNLQLRHHASVASGNYDGPDSSFVVASVHTNGGTDRDSVTVRHAPIRKVVSINGEEVDVESANIHDFTTFEKEELIGSAFMEGIKRKSSGNDDGKNGLGVSSEPKRVLSFRNAVKSIIHSEALMRALKHYSHRSDSEDTEEEEEDLVKLNANQSLVTAVTETQRSQDSAPADVVFSPANGDIAADVEASPVSHLASEVHPVVVAETNAAADAVISAQPRNSYSGEETKLTESETGNSCALIVEGHSHSQQHGNESKPVLDINISEETLKNCDEKPDIRESFLQSVNHNATVPVPSSDSGKVSVVDSSVVVSCVSTELEQSSENTALPQVFGDESLTYVSAVQGIDGVIAEQTTGNNNIGSEASTAPFSMRPVESNQEIPLEQLASSNDVLLQQVSPVPVSSSEVVITTSSSACGEPMVGDDASVALIDSCVVNENVKLLANEAPAKADVDSRPPVVSDDTETDRLTDSLLPTTSTTSPKKTTTDTGCGCCSVQ